jgi:hypothetical protein
MVATLVSFTLRIVINELIFFSLAYIPVVNFPVVNYLPYQANLTLLLTLISLLVVLTVIFKVVHSQSMSIFTAKRLSSVLKV